MGVPSGESIPPPLSDFERGLFAGILIGEGSFGGDGKQPQVTLRMHTRHESLFHWLAASFPRSRLYGPYNHGGRSYYQWMARGGALEEVLPILKEAFGAKIDTYAASRFQEMMEKYEDYFRRQRD